MRWTFEALALVTGIFGELLEMWMNVKTDDLQVNDWMMKGKKKKVQL